MGLFDNLKKSALKAAKESFEKGVLIGSSIKAEKLAERWPEVRRNASKVLVTVESVRKDLLAGYGAEEGREVYLVHQVRVEEKKGFLGSRKVVKLLVSGPYEPGGAPDLSRHFEREEVWEIEVDPGRELEVSASKEAWGVLG